MDGFQKFWNALVTLIWWGGVIALVISLAMLGAKEGGL